MCRLLVTLALTVFVLTIFESARASTCIRNVVKRPQMTPDKETGDRVAQWTEEMKINPEELGSYLEGDIMLTEDHQTNMIHYWPDGIIPITISGDFNEDERKLMANAVRIIEQHTCVRFIKKREKDHDYISITSEKTGCWSAGIGKEGGEQRINLQTPACTGIHTILHEFLHALGFEHEHNRAERDNYVTINWNNIPRDKHHNFNKFMRKADHFDLPYDYDSIMHYSPYAFAENPNLKTIITKVLNKPTGKAKTLSKLTIIKLNIMYDCIKIFSNNIDNNWINNNFNWLDI